jgi:microsomal dipeptidase-like Zn-dependent dipeptidase
VAYITVAHLFNRHIARNAPAIPFIPDHLYHILFPQDPDPPLTALGEALIRAMVRRHILVDITHMSRTTVDATLALLDRIEEEMGATQKVPVVATHTACEFGDAEYNITDAQIAEVARRGGIIGLIASSHWMADGLREPKNLGETLRLIDAHIERIHRVTGSHRFTALGSDLDGFIKPTLHGLRIPSDFSALGRHLEATYGPDAELICAGNALRLLREYWWGDQPVS